MHDLQPFFFQCVMDYIGVHALNLHFRLQKTDMAVTHITPILLMSVNLHKPMLLVTFGMVLIQYILYSGFLRFFQVMITI